MKRNKNVAPIHRAETEVEIRQGFNPHAARRSARRPYLEKALTIMCSSTSTSYRIYVGCAACRHSSSSSKRYKTIYKSDSVVPPPIDFRNRHVGICTSLSAENVSAAASTPARDLG